MPGGHHPFFPLSGLVGAVLCRSRTGFSNRSTSRPLTNPLIDDLRQLAAQQAAAAQLTVVGLQIQSNRVPPSLLIQVRRADGVDVNLDECASFSGVISDALDSSALLPEAYVLEISSPGIGEELLDDRDFRSFRGFPVEVRFQDDEGNAISREGLLLERDEQSIGLNLHGRTSRIPRAAVLSVRLITPQG